MSSRPFSRFISLRFCYYAITRLSTHYASGFFSFLAFSVGIYFIAPFIFCSKSEPHVRHLYKSLVKDTNIVGISQEGQIPCVTSGLKRGSFAKKLCGKFRPGHFEAVVDVIERFIKIINPKKIYLGEKDMQQLKIMEHFISKIYNKIKIIGCKTIRERNGIACSSRNFLLSVYEKKIASKIYKILVNKKKHLIKKEISLDTIKNKILKLGVRKIDYIKLLDVNNLIRPYKKNRKYRIFMAYFLRKTRLIDNI